MAYFVSAVSQATWIFGQIFLDMSVWVIPNVFSI